MSIGDALRRVFRGRSEAEQLALKAEQVALVQGCVYRGGHRTRGRRRHLRLGGTPYSAQRCARCGIWTNLVPEPW